MQLSPQHCGVLLKRIRPMLGYFSRLQRRMEFRGFRQDDKLLLMVKAAHDDLHRLTVELHYRSCGNVGQSSRPKGKDSP